MHIFLPQVYIPFERNQFRQAKQDESETTDQFVTRLFQLRENCDFGTSKEAQVRDQLIDKCRSHDLRKKLLAISGKLTLQKARDIARSMEAAESQARSIESDSRSGNLNSIERGHFDSPKREGGRCYFARDPECKARLATCMKCKKVGYFSKVCKTKEEDTIRPRKGNTRQVTKDDDFAITLQSSGEEIPTVHIELGGVRLEGVLVDSGAGEFETEVCYKDKRCHVCFIVVEDKARAILSRETSEKLAILKLKLMPRKKKPCLEIFLSGLRE